VPVDMSTHGVRADVQTDSSRTVELLRFAWENRRLLFRAGVAGLIVSTIIAFVIPARYSATARLMPPEQNNTGMSTMILGALSAKAGDSLGSLAGDMLNLKNSGAVVIGILQSRTVEDDIINKFDLRRVYWRKKYEDTRKILEQRSDVSEDRKSGIISITVRDRDRQRAAAIAQAYVDEVNAKVSQLTTSSAHRERVFLEERLKKVRQDLSEASTQLSRFASKNTTLDPAVQGKAMLEAVAQLQGDMIAAESQLKSLEQIYTPENIRVRSARARVDELRRQLAKLTGSNASVNAQVEGRANELASPEMYPSVRQLPLLGSNYYDLYREVKIEEAVFEALTKQYEMAKVQEAKEIPTIKVLDSPVPSEHKAWPPRTFIVVSGTIVAIIATLLLLIGSASWSRIDPADPRRMLFSQVSASFEKKFRARANFIGHGGE
jgi:capsule polysaccharide export protein KpsE/RkpR